MMKILLVDGHALFLQGLKNMLIANDIEVLGTAGNSQEALCKVEELQPEIILMDVQMPGQDGIETTRIIKNQYPHIKIVMLTVSQDDNHLFEAIKAGASGYLLKGIDKETFLPLLAGLARGEPPLSPGLAAKVLAEFSRREQERASTADRTSPITALSGQQVGILKFVAQGLTYKNVGDRLQLSESTIKYHMGEITNRLHLENRSQVIAYASEQNLV